MVAGAEAAITGILNSVRTYLPAIIAVTGGIAGFRAILKFIRGAA